MKYGRNLRGGGTHVWRWLAISVAVCSVFGMVIGSYRGVLSRFAGTDAVQSASQHPKFRDYRLQTESVSKNPAIDIGAKPIIVGTDPRPPTPTPPPKVAGSPTGWYIVQSHPTPKPTPVLFPAGQFPKSCGEDLGRMNILLIGVDGGSAGYKRAVRADALMVLGVDFREGTVQLLSIPRDLWVQIPGYEDYPSSQGRINTGYLLGYRLVYPGGGPEFQKQVISQNFGLDLDRHIVVHFDAFETMIDAIGGLDIYLNTAIHDTSYPMGLDNTMVLDFPAGMVHMDGATALMYARTRYADSDFGRMRRQQKVVMAVRDKLLSPQVVMHLPALFKNVNDAVLTDLTWYEIGLLGCAVSQIGLDNIETVVIDQGMTVSTITSGGGSVLEPDMDKIVPALAMFSKEG